MNKKTILTILGLVALVLAVSLGLFIFWGANEVGKTPVDNMKTLTGDMIRVSEPLPNVLVQSPLTIKGSARGSWFFEASFPIKIFDSKGKQLGFAVAQAQGDWMTTDFVPFTATLTFDTPTTEKGVVVFQKDNPSGLPENNRTFSVPIYFLNNASKL